MNTATEQPHAACGAAAQTGNTTPEETSQPRATCGCGHHAAPLATSPAEAVAAGHCGCQRLMWIRRTHSACGLVFGAFLAEHLAATALGIRPALFARYVGGVRWLLGHVPWLEALVFLPLAILVPFGVYLLAKAGLRYHVKKCKRGGKLRFFLQRASALLVLAFLAFHLLTLRVWQPRFAAAETSQGGPSAPVGSGMKTSLAASVRQVWGLLPSAATSSPTRLAVTLFYLLATVAAVYHLVNGLATGAVAWGLTSSPSLSQRILGALALLGVLLGILGAVGWYAFFVGPWFWTVG